MGQLGTPAARLPWVVDHIRKGRREAWVLLCRDRAAFDRAWLEGMIEHHRGAITMVQQIKDEGDSPDVMSLADQVITTQQAEVDEMTGLLPS